MKKNQNLMVFIQEIIYQKKKDGVYVINLDEHADTGTHCVALFCKKKEIIYFDSFGVEHISKENLFKKFIGNKNIKANIFRYKQLIQ